MTGTFRSTISANSHDTHVAHARPFPAKTPIPDRSPVALPARSSSTAVTPKLDDLFAVTLSRLRTLLTKTLGPSLTMDPQRVHCELPPSPCRALTSMDSSSTNIIAGQPGLLTRILTKTISPLGVIAPGGYCLCGLPGPSCQPSPVLFPGPILDQAQQGRSGRRALHVGREHHIKHPKRPGRPGRT